MTISSALTTWTKKKREILKSAIGSKSAKESSFKTNWPLILYFICVISIIALGHVMIFNTSSAEVLDHDLDKSTSHDVIKQMIFALTGACIAASIQKAGYRQLIRWSPVLFGIFTFMLILALIPGIGKEVNGSKRWISLFGISVQPSEFVKYIIPLFFVHRISKIPVKDFKTFLNLIGICTLPIFLIFLEPNNGTIAVIGITLTVLCFITMISWKYWALPLLIAGSIGALSAAYFLPYVSARLKVYMHPESDLQGKGHQPFQAKIAAGSGQLFGKGPGNSWQKLSYLPEAQNDYIAAIYAEEFGFIGILILILLYMTIAYLGFYFASRSADLGGFYLASSITFLIAFQAFLNLGVVSGLLPSTGLNLPLFSQGGSSLIANMAGVGIIVSIASTKTTV